MNSTYESLKLLIQSRFEDYLWMRKPAKVAGIKITGIKVAGIKITGMKVEWRAEPLNLRLAQSFHARAGRFANHVSI